MLRRACLIGAVLWPAAIVAAAFAAGRPEPGSAARAFVLAVYSLGSVICHQRPERSFHVWMAQLPVCARCTGIYLGAGLAAMAAAPGWTGRRWRERPAAALLVAAVPSVITLVYEWTTGSMVPNIARAAAGAPLGGALALVLLAAAEAKRPEVN